jgi:hypothetical protein
MVFEPIGGSLAAIALIFPIYDACDCIIAGCMVMRSFGRDIQLLWKQLDGQWVRLKLIMEQLEIIETYFRECEALVHKQFSEWIPFDTPFCACRELR